MDKETSPGCTNINDEFWFLKINKYQRDNLYNLLMMIWDNNPAPLGVLNSGDWLPELLKMMEGIYDPSGLIDTANNNNNYQTLPISVNKNQYLTQRDFKLWFKIKVENDAKINWEKNIKVFNNG